MKRLPIRLDGRFRLQVQGVTLASAVDSLRDWAELGQVSAARSRCEAQCKSVAARELIRTSGLAGLGQLDFDPQLDLGQDRIEARVA